MPRKKLEELEAKPAEKPKAEQMKEMPKYDATVVTEGGTRKVKLDLEVDTSIKDLGPNPYAKIIHMAKAVDAWRIFPRAFLTVYIFLLYKTVLWYMTLPDPSMNQSAIISVVVGAGAAWFGLYTGTSKK
jgi:hypothetical protein